jgi:hypothetical protein
MCNNISSLKLIMYDYDFIISTNSNNSVALVCELTIPAERPPLVGEVSAIFCG